MDTRLQIINPDAFMPKELDTACQILKNGGLVAFPTETVYGLGGDALRTDAAACIYKAKGRPSDNPLIVHIAKADDMEKLALSVPDSAKRLAAAFWPGPLTMVLDKSELVPYGTTGGLDTVAVRMPAHRIALELIRRSGVYVAAPSANTSGRPSPTRAEHVWEDLNGKIDYVIDGGRVGIGLESTIVDLTGEIPMILRPGAVTKSMLEQVIGRVEYDPAVISRDIREDAAAKAPGMKYRHYAPKGKMVIVEGSRENVVARINGLVRQKEGESVAVIASQETRECYPGAEVYCVGSRKDESQIAASLYDVLRKMDDLGVKWIYAESFDSEGLGQAIMNRMFKAAGYCAVDADKG